MSFLTGTSRFMPSIKFIFSIPSSRILVTAHMNILYFLNSCNSYSLPGLQGVRTFQLPNLLVLLGLRMLWVDCGSLRPPRTRGLRRTMGHLLKSSIYLGFVENTLNKSPLRRCVLHYQRLKGRARSIMMGWWMASNR